jgi:hypothetical protein
MSLFILEGVARKPANLVTMGYESRIWSSGRTTYVLVHPRAAQGMAAAVSYVMQRAR